MTKPSHKVQTGLSSRLTREVKMRWISYLPFDFPERLGAWEQADGRHPMALPWLLDRTPYKVWLAEVMLQQRQVTTAIECFTRFLNRFPSVSDLARAPAEEVLELWGGRTCHRARNLHACAKIVAEVHGGEFPHNAAELATLPGVDPSTAAAIASICFGERISIYDGSVKRIVARISGYEGDLASVDHVRELFDIAQSSTPEDPVHMPRHTQALMDLGATVCTATNPSCAMCPFERDCVAHAKEKELELPVNTRALH